MSISQKIDDLKEIVGPEGLEVLKELEELVTPYEPGFHLDRLTQAILSKEDPADEDPERVHELIDALHSSTARYSRPDPDRFLAFKKDLGRFFLNCHTFVDLEMLHAVWEYMLLYHRVFSEPKKICGLPRYTCHVTDCEGRFSGPEDTVCPTCGAYRALCKNPPASNGRCTRVSTHGGQNISGPLNDRMKHLGRAGLYRQSLNGELQRMYVEAMTDENYISVAPEMGALAARSGELLGQIGDIDYLAVSSQVQQAIRRMRKSIAEGEYYNVEKEATVIESLLTGVADDKRRWDEVAALSGRLGRLAEAERKRLIEAQKMITVQEMYMLQQETLAQFRDTASVIAVKIIELVAGGTDLGPNQVRALILRTMHSVTKGDLHVDYHLDKGEALEQAVIEGSLGKQGGTVAEPSLGEQEETVAEGKLGDS